MPHGLEYIVRPFQSPGSLGNVVIPGTPDRTEEKAHIVWGGKGTMPSTKLVNPSTEVRTKEEKLTEQNRDSDTVRIIGNDGESYVDVARPRRLRLDKYETGADTQLDLKFYQAGWKFDPALDPYLRNFAASSAGTERVGPSWVTWNLKNV